MKYTMIFMLLLSISLQGQGEIADNSEIACLGYLQESAIGNHTSILSAPSRGVEVSAIERSLIGHIEHRWELLDPVIGELAVALYSANDLEVLGCDLFLLLYMFPGEAI